MSVIGGTIAVDTLFELPPVDEGAAERQATRSGGKARMRFANRTQIVFRPLCLEQLLPEDHEARIVWNYVEELDLTPLIERIQSVEGEAGRSATDPRILLALWLYATLQGVGSARRLDELCVDHVAYQWICGDVSMNYHTLSDFRSANVEFLDKVFTDGIAVLMKEGLVDLHRVAQDGMRVRANAGAASFRREKTLQECAEEAAKQIEALRAELESDPGATTARQKAARERAARERAERVKKAMEQLPDQQAKKKGDEKDKARASTTDPEAHVMKMGDGGFRPAYNVQFATDTATQLIVGVEVVTSGGDQGQMAPMVEQIQERHGVVPDEYLVDGGFAKKEDIEKLSTPEYDTVVFAPVQTPKTSKSGVQRGPHEPRPDDGPGVAAWRVRMGTPEAKEIYKDRAATAECVNAIARNRGMQQFKVRGLRKVQAVTLLYALAHNLMRAVKLRAKAAAGMA
jgi:transposase